MVKKSLIGFYQKLVLDYPKTVLLGLLLLTLGLAAGLPNFKLDASADALTLEHDRDLDYFREINQRYGTGGFLVVTYSPYGTDLFSDASVELLEEIRDRLLEVEGIHGINSMLDVPLLYSPRLSIGQLGDEWRTLLTPGVDRDAAREEFWHSPIYRDMVLSPDGQTTAMLLNLDVDDEYINLVRYRDALRLKRVEEGLAPAEEAELDRVSKEVIERRTAQTQRDHNRVEEIRQLLDPYRDRAELFLGGPTMITADMVSYIRGDLQTFGAGVMLFIIVLLGVIFRQLRWVVLPLAICGVSVLMMLGFLSWVDWRLTVISSNFVALQIILTMAIVIHVIVRYRELDEEFPDWSHREVVREAITFMGRPCFYTVITSIVAFASLVVSDIRPVIDFGWMMTIGLTVSFFVAFLILPAGLMLVGRSASKGGRQRNTASLTRWFAHLTERHGTAVLVGTGLATVLAVVGISRLDVETRFIDYFHEDTEIFQGLQTIDTRLGGTMPLDIVVRAPEGAVVHQYTAAELAEGEEAYDDYGNDGYDDPFGFEGDPFAVDDVETLDINSYWFTRAGLDQLEQLHEWLEAQPEMGKVTSVVTAFHVANDLMGRRLNDFELTFLRQSLSDANSDYLLAPYLSDELNETRIQIRVQESTPGLRRGELIERVYDYAHNEVGLEVGQVRLTGLMVLYRNMLQSLFSSQVMTLGVVFLAITAMLTMLFQSLKVALVGIVPNVLAAAMVLGGMGLAGIPLDMMTITIAAITVGIGVDDTIHYVHRFQRELSIDGDYMAAMHRSHGTIGRAMYYTSVIIIFGFSILAMSNFVPTLYFGLLTGAAMLAALFGALLLLPKLILVTRPFKRTLAGEERH